MTHNQVDVDAPQFALRLTTEQVESPFDRAFRNAERKAQSGIERIQEQALARQQSLYAEQTSAAEFVRAITIHV